MDRLAISPQCGFASVMVGNETHGDAQWRMLDLVERVADRIWGCACGSLRVEHAPPRHLTRIVAPAGLPGTVVAPQIV